MDVHKTLIERAKIKDACLKSDEKKGMAIALIKKPDNGILYFFKYWLWTYDPRKTPSEIPFVPYDYQETYILELNNDIKNGVSQGTEKSRDMGVTWMILGVFLYRWLVYSENFLVGSRKEELVDTIGDMDSHFERLRFMLERLPDWLLQAFGYSRKNQGYMKIFKASGASITGESMNEDFSRQGRYNAILLDEFAFVDSPETIWRACGDSAPCKLPVSTPNGTNNFFYHLRKSNMVKFKTLHWKLHPNKTEAWYNEQVVNRSAKDVAQELDINYSVSAGTPFYKGFSRGLHLRKMRISKDRQLILGWDYGWNHPNCSVHQISTEGIWIIVDNIFGENQTISEFADYVREYLNETYPGFVFTERGFGDPAGRQASDKSRLSSEKILNDKGFEVMSMPSNLPVSNYDARKTIIESKLRTLIDGIPALVVNDVPNNNIIVEGFEGGYRYPDANKYGGIAEKPVEDGFFEHPFNSIEYVAVNLFRAIHRAKPESIPDTTYYRPRPVYRVGERQTVNAGIGYGN